MAQSRAEGSSCLLAWIGCHAFSHGRSSKPVLFIESSGFVVAYAHTQAARACVCIEQGGGTLNKSRIGMDQPAGPASLRVKFTNFSARGSPPSSTQEMKIPVSGMLAHAPPAPTHAEALLNSSTDSICAGLRRAAYFNKGRQPVSDTTHPPSLQWCSPASGCQQQCTSGKTAVGALAFLR